MQPASSCAVAEFRRQVHARLGSETVRALHRPSAVLDVCTRIFDTLGASATSAALQLDRHWRNARTLATHDPAAFKVRMAGDWLVNGTPPTAYTSAGEVSEGD